MTNAHLTDETVTHSPGPWQDDSMLFTAGWRCIVNTPDGCSFDIADPRNRKTTARDAANARLIAAAPDLLACCRYLLGMPAILCECGQPDCATTRLRAAIAKVEVRTRG